jgi:hypothetical protein
VFFGDNKSHFKDKEPKKYFTNKLSVLLVNKEKSTVKLSKIGKTECANWNAGTPGTWKFSDFWQKSSTAYYRQNYKKYVYKKYIASRMIVQLMF